MERRWAWAAIIPLLAAGCLVGAAAPAGPTGLAAGASPASPPAASGPATGDHARGAGAADRARDRHSASHPSASHPSAGHPSPGRPDPAAICAAEPSLFGRRAGDAAVAYAMLRQGRVELAPHPPRRLPRDPRWSERLVDEDNWQAKYQALTWLDVLRREAIRLRVADPGLAAKYRERYQFLLRDFAEASADRARPPSPWTWYDHPTGQRSAVLACATTLLGHPAWLVRAMRQHAAELSDPAAYKARGNHSLMQDSGLLSLGCALPDASARQLAISRADRLLLRSVDAQGVTDEGSIGYQRNNSTWWSELAAKRRACGLSVPGTWDRIDLMSDFLAAAGMPDGTVAAFGDTYLGTKAPAGSDGVQRQRTSLFARGYLFSRSAGGAGSASMLAMRFGQSFAEQAHGHQDAGNVLFHAFGRRLVTDSGLYTYGGSRWRNHVKSPYAHNVLTADGARYRRDATSPLLDYAESDDYVRATVRIGVIEGAEWTRTVLHSRRGGWLLVDDQVVQGSARRLTQRWNLPQGGRFKLGRAGLDQLGDGTALSVRFLAGAPKLALRRGAHSAAHGYAVGWRSPRHAQIEPSPTLEASTTARAWHVVTLIAARPAGQVAHTVRARDVQVTAGQVRAAIITPRGTERISIPVGA